MEIIRVKTKNIFKLKVENPKKKKQNVILDGVLFKRDSRVTICVKCGKILCHKHNHPYVCTSAGNWYNIKKKYKYKVFGKYRLKLYIKKCEIESWKEYVGSYSN